MKKFLLTLIVTMLAFVGTWAQGAPEQASKSVYRFTSTAQGNLYTFEGEHYIVATTDENAVCSQDYYILSQYAPTDAPANEGISSFKVTTYYYVDNDGDYTCAFGQSYDADKTYAIASGSLLDFRDETTKNNYLTTVRKKVFSSSHGDVTNGVLYVEENGVNIGTVKVGDIYDPTKQYVNSQTNYHITTADWESWGGQYLEDKDITTFLDEVMGSVYVKVDGAYKAISDNSYNDSEEYYSVTFTNLTTDEKTAVAGNSSNFAIAYFVKGLESPSGLYYYNSSTASYVEVNNGDAFLGDDKYFKQEDSYALRTPAELATLGYASKITTYYNCDVATEEENKIYTVSYHFYDNSYGSYKDYIRDSHSDISNYYTLDVKCSDSNQSFKNSLAELFSAVKECDGILNLVIADFANYGFNSVDAIDLANLKGSSVKRIILPDATWTDATILSNVTNSDAGGNVYVPIVQAYNSNPSTKNVEIIHSFAAGSLNDIRDAHYYSANIDNAYWIEINGSINADDVVFINGIHNDRLNLAGATNASHDEEALREALHGFTNDYVKYLSWPVFSTEPSNPLYTDLYEQCDQLVAVGQYVDMGSEPVEVNGLTVMVKNGKFVAYTEEPGKIKEITDMLAVVSVNNTTIKHLKISGNLNALDLYKYDSSYSKIGKDGHLYFTEPVNEYATMDQSDRKSAADANGEYISTGALDGCGAIVSIDLSDAVFEKYEDMTLRNLNLLGAATKTVKIPTSSLVTELPADFLNAATQIEEICIPANIERIHARAFYGLHLKHVWTTGTDPDVKYDNGATYEVGAEGSKTLESYNYGDEIPAGAKMVYGTYTFSPNLKFIGSGTFASSTNIHDVYMLGRQAPECCVNAFSSVSYVANNSYEASAVVDKIERDSYANSKYAWMTVLHFPAECTTAEAKLYTDVTRNYSIASDERDGRGKIIYYPTMYEWNRSYLQGTTGYLWNANGADRNGMSGTAMKFYNNNAAKETNTPMTDTWDALDQAVFQATFNAYYAASDNSQKESAIFYSTDVTTTPDDESLPYNTTLYNADYRGWHQFVLAAYGYSDDYVYDFNDFSDNNWWTICEPFSLTAKEMKQAFGENVDLRKLKSVTRNVAGQTITLNFDTNHLIGAADNDVVLEAGVPYMIKPAKADRSNPDNMVLTFEKSIENDARFAPKSSTELINLLTNGKYDVPAIITNNIGDFIEPTKSMEFNGQTVNVHKNLTYSMVGTFFKYYFPLYCYFLGWDSKAGKVAFFWNNKLDKVNRTWNPFTAIIVPRWKNSDGFYTPNGEFETIHYNYNSKDVVGTTDDLGGINMQDVDVVPDDWYGPISSDAKKVGYSLNFNFDAEDNATAIRNAAVKANNDNKVYNLNGQLMNNGLTKGIYVTNGKKFIVK